MSSLNIDLIQEDILNQKIDACVCGIHRSMDLNKGFLSKIISNAAGETLQQNLSLTNRNGDLKNGEIVESVPHKLSSKFKHLYFICLKTWRPGNEDDLQGAVERILDDAAGRFFTSVVFPPLGTGGQKYPPRHVALAFLQGILAHSIDNPDSSITVVKISLFQQKDEMLQAFTDILVKGVDMYEAFSQAPMPSNNHPDGESNDNNHSSQAHSGLINCLSKIPVEGKKKQPTNVDKLSLPNL